MSNARGPALIISKPAQLKALGHPLRLRVLEVLGESDEQLTNRELANRLGVDPGHLHFHVRMLLGAGLIERVEGTGGREKPYRAVAGHVQIAPDLVASGAANDARAAMLEAVNRGFADYSGEGRWRSAQITVRMDPEKLREIFEVLCAEVDRYEDAEREPILITLIGHPHPSAEEAPS